MRLFIAIPISEYITDKLAQNLKPVQQSLAGEEVRYQPPVKWHFTLVFLGEQPESDVEIIAESVEEIAQSINPPEVVINKIQYGPSPKNPRMIWAKTDRETSQSLGKAQKKLQTKLESNGVAWDKDTRRYKGHITLARFDPKDLKNPPEIETDFHLEYSPDRIELLESELTPNGSKYTLLHEAKV